MQSLPDFVCHVCQARFPSSKEEETAHYVNQAPLRPISSVRVNATRALPGLLNEKVGSPDVWPARQVVSRILKKVMSALCVTRVCGRMVRTPLGACRANRVRTPHEKGQQRVSTARQEQWRKIREKIHAVNVRRECGKMRVVRKFVRVCGQGTNGLPRRPKLRVLLASKARVVPHDAKSVPPVNFKTCLVVRPVFHAPKDLLKKRLDLLCA